MGLVALKQPDRNALDVAKEMAEEFNSEELFVALNAICVAAHDPRLRQPAR